MLVSHVKQFIYTKTIKTASTSVESFFERFCMPMGEWKPTLFRDEYVSETGIIGYRGPPGGDLLRRCKWRDHMRAAVIRRQLGTEIWDSYFKFCVVRNPFEKAVSAYHFFIEMDRRGQRELKLSESDDEISRFGEFVRKYLIRRRIADDRRCYMIGNQFCMDYVIRYERLQEGLKHVCDVINVSFARQKLRSMVSGYRPANRSLSDYYDQSTRELVARHFEFELAKFGYDFPGRH